MPECLGLASLLQTCAVFVGGHGCFTIEPALNCGKAGVPDIAQQEKTFGDREGTLEQMGVALAHGRRAIEVTGKFGFVLPRTT